VKAHSPLRSEAPKTPVTSLSRSRTRALSLRTQQVLSYESEHTQPAEGLERHQKHQRSRSLTHKPLSFSHTLSALLRNCARHEVRKTRGSCLVSCARHDTRCARHEVCKTRTPRRGASVESKTLMTSLSHTHTHTHTHSHTHKLSLTHQELS